jgi:septum formation protein
VRNFSDAWLDMYLRDIGEEVLHSVGAYQLEGLGVQLFDRVQGDWFAVLGLPMVELLEALRREGVITA